MRLTFFPQSPYILLFCFPLFFFLIISPANTSKTKDAKLVIALGSLNVGANGKDIPSPVLTGLTKLSIFFTQHSHTFLLLDSSMKCFEFVTPVGSAPFNLKIIFLGNGITIGVVAKIFPIFAHSGLSV